MTTSNQTKLWRESAAFGALWGALEITLGSFLHSLRVPFTGATLTIIASIVVISARMIFPHRGFCIRAAMVCAILKSFSPGGIIFGPMCAIMGEGLVIELAFLSPSVRFSAALGGCLASLWTFIQYFVIRLIHFGTDIFKLYLAMIKKAAKSIGVPESWGWPALILAVVITSLIGATAGIIGYNLGNRAKKKLSQLKEDALRNKTEGSHVGQNTDFELQNRFLPPFEEPLHTKTENFSAKETLSTAEVENFSAEETTSPVETGFTQIHKTLSEYQIDLPQKLKVLQESQTKHLKVEEGLSESRTDLLQNEKVLQESQTKHFTIEKSLSESRTDLLQNEKVPRESQTKHFTIEKSLSESRTDLYSAEEGLSESRTDLFQNEKNVSALQTDLFCSKEVVSESKPDDSCSKEVVSESQTDFSCLKEVVSDLKERS